MSAYAFGLKTPRDFLNKARREIERLENSSSREDVADAAINAAVTLWSLNEWIARSDRPACVDAIARIKAENQSGKNAPKKILHEHIAKDQNIRHCRDIANGAKHLELHDDKEEIGSTTVSSVTRSVVLNEDALESAFEKYIAKGTVVETDASAMPAIAMAPWPTTYTAKIILDDGTRLRAAEVFRSALKYWEQFFEKYGL